MKKGISLPVETLVAILVALIILVGLVAMFFGTSGQSKGQTDASAAFRAECNKFFTAGGCQREVPIVQSMSNAAIGVGLNVGCASSTCTAAENTARWNTVRAACCG